MALKVGIRVGHRWGTGRILFIDQELTLPYLVEFDNALPDGDGHSGGGYGAPKGKPYHCWWVRRNEIEVITSNIWKGKERQLK